MKINKIEKIVALQIEAIKNIKIDKVTVWDSGNGSDGGSSTANFLSGMIKSLPPLHDVAEIAGLDLPKYLGAIADHKGAPADQAGDGRDLKPSSVVSEEIHIVPDDTDLPTPE